MANAAAILAEKKYNRLLNLWDPPKDLDASTWTRFDKRDELKTILTELFATGEPLPGPATQESATEYLPIADTKKAIKNYFGYENTAAGIFKEFIIAKTNTLLIIRESHSSGSDPRPTGLYVSQDTGPNDVITNPNFIITPGTLLDPASKTKIGADFSLIQKYPSLPIDYIRRLKLDHIMTDISGSKNAANTEFTITIKTTIGDGAAGTISTKLNANFDPLSEAGDGTYFTGNPTKNKYILDNQATLTTVATRDAVKKYLLVKELGDTLQVQWLNYIFDNLVGGDPYNRGNTVIITNDNVVLYRGLINKVAVILTYMGKTRLYKSREGNAAAQAAIDASLMATIRSETIRHNLSVIKVIQDVITKGAGDEAWVGGNKWYKAETKTFALRYLRKLKEKLENLNKDFDIYLSKLPNPTACKDFAGNAHFLCPFVWCKGGYYKQVPTVTYLLPDNTLQFPAASFTALSLTKTKLEDGTFVKVGSLDAGGGARQQGGARKKVSDKELAATDATTSAKRKALIAASIDEWKESTPVDHTIPREIVDQAIENPAPTIEIAGKAENIELADKWGANVTATTKAALEANNFFLYYYVRDFYPKIFTLAYVFKKAIDKIITYGPTFIAEVEAELATATTALAEAQRNLDGIGKTKSHNAERATAQEKVTDAEHVKEYIEFVLEERRAVVGFATTAKAKYPNVPSDKTLMYAYEIDGRFNAANIFIYDSDAISALSQQQRAKLANDAFDATLEAISLAMYFIKAFPQMQTHHMANFFKKMKSGATKHGLKDFETEVGIIVGQQFAPVIEELGMVQLGGGITPINPLVANAMDIYEIYYSLNLQAAYNDRSVTNEELERALVKSTASQFIQLRKDRQRMLDILTLSNVGASMKHAGIKRGAVTGLTANNWALERPLSAVGMGPMTQMAVVGMGGKRRHRHRKTQKKRKQGRKTRKGRGKK